MNKLLLFPMGFMFILTLVSISFSGTSSYYSGTTQNLSQSGQFNQYGTNSANGSINIPEASSHTFGFWNDAAGFVIILTFAIGIGIISGIHFLGSGLSDTSQKMIFTSILYLGIWAALSVASSQFLFGVTDITAFLWVGLTLVYTLGLGSELSSSPAAT